MKERFSIGETAKLMGISSQTLRYYSNEGLLKPEYIDKKTGYRYYSFNQLHFIDRIKYLRSLQIPLSDIKTALKDGRAETLVPFLKKRHAEIEETIDMLSSAKDDIKWYIDYFEYAKKHMGIKYPYIKYFPKRYAIGTHCENESVSSVETRLDAIRGDSSIKHLSYLRQLGYIFDYRKFIEGEFYPSQHYMFLKEEPKYLPEKYKENLLTFPAGEYMCFMSKIRSKNWKAKDISGLFDTGVKDAFIIVNEFEDSLVEYQNSPHEIQMLLEEKL